MPGRRQIIDFALRIVPTCASVGLLLFGGFGCKVGWDHARSKEYATRLGADRI